MSYPDAIYEHREMRNLPGITYEPTKKQTLYAEDIQNLANAITEIQTVLGLNVNGGYATVAQRLDNTGGAGGEWTKLYEIENTIEAKEIECPNLNLSSDKEYRIDYEIQTKSQSNRWTWVVDTGAGTSYGQITYPTSSGVATTTSGSNYIISHTTQNFEGTIKMRVYLSPGIGTSVRVNWRSEWRSAVTAVPTWAVGIAERGTSANITKFTISLGSLYMNAGTKATVYKRNF